MSIFEALLLGLVQGLTEFIPVSSSGHLVIFQTVLSGAGDHLFLEWINIGTVLALLVFFRRRIWNICTDVFVRRDWRVALNVLVAAVPAGLVGFFFSSIISSAAFFASIWTVVVTLATVGVLLVVLERLPKASPVKDIDVLPWKRAVGVGVAQVAALVPGTSRSGATIIAGRLAGFSREKAAEFSFLVSIPIMLGVTLKLLVSSTDRAYFMDNALALVVGNTAAFISGIIAVGFLMRFLEKKSLAVFGWYRIVLAAVVATLLLGGVIV